MQLIYAVALQFRRLAKRHAKAHNNTTVLYQSHGEEPFRSIWCDEGCRVVQIRHLLRIYERSIRVGGSLQRPNVLGLAPHPKRNGTGRRAG